MVTDCVMETGSSKRLSLWFKPDNLLSVRKMTKSYQRFSDGQRDRSATQPTIMTHESTFPSKNVGCEQNDDIDKYSEESLFDMMFKLQGRIDDQRATMPAFLIRHQQLNTDELPPNTPEELDNDPVTQILKLGPPYPMIVLPTLGDCWWDEGNTHALLPDDQPVIHDADLTQCKLSENNAFNEYCDNFAGKEHVNFFGNDSKHGDLILSVLHCDDQYRVILRWRERSICDVVKASALKTDFPGPRDFVKKLLDDDVDVDRFHQVAVPRASDAITKFDGYYVENRQKVGVIYQKFGQTTENAFFNNQDDSRSFREFLDMMGARIELKGFAKYRAGLDVTSGQTGEYSYFTEFQNREIMFHVSTLLPHFPCDSNNLERKRHIGNDIVTIIFQDENTPFNPSSIPSHFLYVYIVVQVVNSTTSDTYYKVCVAAKDGVPRFTPRLPNPSIFRKGAGFRKFLLTKILNAQTAAITADPFAKLVRRSRTAHLKTLVNDFALSNRRILNNELATSSSPEPSAKSGLLSSFRSAWNRNYRSESIHSPDSLATSKLSGQSLSLNDITNINGVTKKTVTVKKTNSKEKKKPKKDKSPPFIRPVSVSSEYKDEPRSRFFTNRMFEEQSRSQISLREIEASEQNADSDASASGSDIQQLRAEVNRLKMEKMDLIRQNVQLKVEVAKQQEKS